MNYETKTALFKACCRPVITYGLENMVLTDTDIQKVKRNEGNMIKNMLNLPKQARSTPLLDALKIVPFAEYARIAKLELVVRIANNP